jgi:hypothetical protein
MRRNITSYTGVAVQEPSASQGWIPVIHLQLDICAMFLDVVCIVNTVEARADVDYFDFAIL